MEKENDYFFLGYVTDRLHQDTIHNTKKYKSYKEAYDAAKKLKSKLFGAKNDRYTYGVYEDRY